jgi:hypothetical protein
MPIGRKNKSALIAALLETKRKGELLEISLLFQGLEVEAKRVRMANRRLSRRIDDLFRHSMEDWWGKAAILKKNLQKGNANLQTSIRAVKKAEKIARHVDKALGYLVEAANTAAKLLG